MKCIKCGFENEKDARFCENCGTPLSEKKHYRIKMPAWLIKQSKKKWYYIVTTIILLCAVPLIGFGLYEMREPWNRYSVTESMYEGEHLRGVGKDGLFGFVEDEGWWHAEIIPLKYKQIGWFNNGLAPVQDVAGGYWGYINEKGEKIIPFRYDDALSFSDNMLAPVSKQGNWGYINEKDKEIIPFVYDKALRFSDGLAAVRYGNKWGFIDKFGHVKIPFIYDLIDAADTFSFYQSRVYLNNKWYNISPIGIPCGIEARQAEVVSPAPIYKLIDGEYIEQNIGREQGTIISIDFVYGEYGVCVNAADGEDAEFYFIKLDDIQFQEGVMAA